MKLLIVLTPFAKKLSAFSGQLSANPDGGRSGLTQNLQALSG